MRRLAAVLLFCLLVIKTGTSQCETLYGPYLSNAGEIKLLVTKQPPKLFLDVMLQNNQADANGWKSIHRFQINSLQYVAPLRPDDSDFIIVSEAGSSYETLIFEIKAPGSVTVQLDARGRWFPEVLYAGLANTPFVILREDKGGRFETADIYVLEGERYKHVQTVSYDKKLEVVLRVSQKIDGELKARQKGVTVRP